MNVCTEHACERRCWTVHACTTNSVYIAIFCNNLPQGRAEENGRSNPVAAGGGREWGEDAGGNVASFLQAAADQMGLIALAEGETEGA